MCCKDFERVLAHVTRVCEVRELCHLHNDSFTELKALLFIREHSTLFKVSCTPKRQHTQSYYLNTLYNYLESTIQAFILNEQRTLMIGIQIVRKTLVYEDVR